MFAFISRSRADQAWFAAGLASSYPDLTDDSAISEARPCGEADSQPGCKVFSVPGGNIDSASEVPLSDVYEGADLQDQVLVFRYRGKFHAVDHVSRSC